MAWLTLCDNDPLVRTLSDIFRASIVRIPEQRLQPMKVIAAQKGKLAYRGSLSQLVSGGSGLAAITPDSSEMADVAGKRSRQVDVKLGLDILDGFLRGFGVPAAASVAEQFSKAFQVSFSFSKVQRFFIEPSRLGQLLKGKSLDSQNPVVTSFLGEDRWKCLVIDSVITSRDFTIHADQKSQNTLHLDVPAIEQVLSKAKLDVKVASTTAASLTFTGAHPLSFAFSYQRLMLNEQAKIMEISPDIKPLAFAGEGLLSPGAAPAKQHTAMIEFEDS